MNIIPLIKLTQLDTKPFYYGIVKFNNLKNIIKETARSNSINEFQRDLDSDRADKIGNFINKTVATSSSIMPFPTPLIIATNVLEVIPWDTDEPLTEEKIEEYFTIYDKYKSVEELIDYFFNELEFFDDDFKEKLLNTDGSFKSKETKKEFCEAFCTPKPIMLNTNLYFSNKVDKMLIVDGQHRFFGIQKFLESSGQYNDFELMIAFLPNFDNFEQSKIFANINFTQKPVNRSLYYDIFGHLPDEESPLKYAHEITKILNSKGMLKNTIKMLGVGPGIISQSSIASVIEKNLINKRGAFHTLYTSYEKNKKDTFIELATLIQYFYDAIHEKIPEYFPIEASARSVIKKINSSDKKNFIAEFDSEIEIKVTDVFKTLSECDSTIEICIENSSLTDIERTDFYNKFCKAFKYSAPMFYSNEYNKTLLKVPGIYALLKIFNDLFNDLNEEHGPGIEYLISKNSDVRIFYQENMSIILECPDVFFRSQKSGGGGIQSFLYKKLKLVIFGIDNFSENDFKELFTNDELNSIYKTKKFKSMFTTDDLNKLKEKLTQ